MSINLLDIPFVCVKRLSSHFVVEDGEWQIFKQSFRGVVDINRIKSVSEAIETIFSTLAVRGWTLRDVVLHLERLRLDKAQLMLNRTFVPISITKEPVLVDDCVVCEATGFPYPRYEWTLDEVSVSSYMDDLRSVVKIDSLPNHGTLICHARNETDLPTLAGKKWAQLKMPQKSEVVSKPFEIIESVFAKFGAKASCSACSLEHILAALSLNDIHDEGELTESQVAKLDSTLGCSAVDKVALLICNSKYENLPRLSSPLQDGGTLAAILVELGFKTVSMADLNHAEMNAIVREYCAMLSVGVYALFYFTGHGVEAAGQCYLFPIDATESFTAKDCVCSQQVLSQMQEMSPSLNVILLDMCRRYDAPSWENFMKEHEFIPVVNRNTLFGYATSGGESAFEVTGEENGVFMRYLRKYLTEPVAVSKVMDCVMQDVSQDARVSDAQFPEVRHNLGIPRSLCDPVVSKGHTSTFNRRAYRWQTLHTLPVPKKIRVTLETTVRDDADENAPRCAHEQDASAPRDARAPREALVSIWFDFYRLFSNLVYMFTSVRRACEEYASDTSNLAATLSFPLMGDSVTVLERVSMKTSKGMLSRYLLASLQKFDQPLKCTILICNDSEPGKVLGRAQDVLIGEVLVSNLRLFS